MSIRCPLIVVVLLVISFSTISPATAQTIRERIDSRRKEASRPKSPDQAAPKPGEAGEFAAEEITIGKVERVYRLVVPKTVDLQKPAPLVVAFHGMLIDSKDLMPRYTHLNEAAEANKFLIAYPNAIDRSWGLAPEKVAADLAMFDALVVKLGKQYKIDPQRIYVLGMSNGGYFAHVVAKERSKTVAAVAAHSGPLGLQTLLGVKADRKFPVLIVYGDKDQIFPTAFFEENRDKYQKEGHEVKYIKVPNLGHMWANEVQINDTIWEFFEKHPLPEK
jgi:polyhydroxybutyrate depolymerase